MTTEFVYATYIKSTPAKVWEAITSQEFQRQYWGDGISADWNKKGSKWHKETSGACSIHGEVLESNPPKRLVITWVDAAENSTSKVTYEIEAIEDLVCLNVVHSGLEAGSNTAGKVAIGWPRVISCIKTLLETGKPLNTWAGLDMNHDKDAA